MFIDDKHDKVNSGWFLFYLRLMLPWVMGVGFVNTCTVSGKWNVTGLFQDFMDRCIKF